MLQCDSSCARHSTMRWQSREQVLPAGEKNESKQVYLLAWESWERCGGTSQEDEGQWSRRTSSIICTNPSSAYRWQRLHQPISCEQMQVAAPWVMTAVERPGPANHLDHPSAATFSLHLLRRPVGIRFSQTLAKSFTLADMHSRRWICREV